MYSLVSVVVSRLLSVLVLVLLTLGSAQSQRFDQIAKNAEKALAEDRANDAVHLYQQALHLQPSWGEGWWSLGSLLYDQDRFGEAAASFRHFVALTSKRGPAYAFLGLCEYETHDYQKALEHFRSWASLGWPGSRELIDVAAFHFALLLTRDGKFVQALYLLTPEVVRLGNAPAITEAMGLASLRMRNLPEDYPPERREMVWLAGEAASYAEHFPPDYPQAGEYANRLVSHYGQQPEVHYFRGVLFTFEKKNSSEAAKEFGEELRISPNHVLAMVELAGLEIGSNHLDEALSLAKRAIALEPNNAQAHDAMGHALLASDRLNESAHELEMAKRLAPASADIRSHLAMVYGRLGRSREARAEAALSLSLKKKEDVLVPPQEKLKIVEQAEKP